MTHEWVLPDDLTAAGAARAHVDEVLETIGVADHIRDDAILIASELAANAARHGQPPITLRLGASGDRIRITVANHGNSPDPRILTADLESGHGRGLAMVEALAVEVGWERDGERLDVWAELPR